MTPHSFSHIYELFATFTLAYIIIDELTENPFLKLISENILKKYNTIDEIFSEINSKIAGHKISIESINILKLDDPLIKEGLPKQKVNIEAIEKRVANLFDKIKKRIKRNYKTKIFVFLNCYLLLYCISMLFFGGLYEEEISTDSVVDNTNLNLDYSVFVFCILCILFLIIGWFFDKQSNKKKDESRFTLDDEGEDDKKPSFLIKNGYYLTGGYYLLAVGISVFIFFNHVRFGFDFQNQNAHQILIISSVFIPISNFIIYFFKANKRANGCLPALTQHAQENKTGYLKELKTTEDFIGTCNYINALSINTVEVTQ